MNKKKLIRARFRTSVFTRDKYKCKICNDSNEILDAHHILPRKQMPNGGYVKENGVTLCPSCHLEAEDFLNGDLTTFAGKNYDYSPANFLKLIGSSVELAYEKSKLL